MNEALIRQLVGQRPCGLLTDIDGTISPIASTPGEAQVLAPVREALRLLTRQLDLVAAISGRAAADAGALAGLPEMIYVSNHGLETARRVVPTPKDG